MAHIAVDIRTDLNENVFDMKEHRYNILYIFNSGKLATPKGYTMKTDNKENSGLDTISEAKVLPTWVVGNAARLENQSHLLGVFDVSDLSTSQPL
jgi:hypothetical protein